LNALRHAAEGKRGRKGGSRGEDATPRRVGMGPGLDQRAAPDRVPTDHGPAAACVGGTLCFE
jgi:hypothetical protein